MVHSFRLTLMGAGGPNFGVALDVNVTQWKVQSVIANALLLDYSILGPLSRAFYGMTLLPHGRTRTIIQTPFLGAKYCESA
jgi:hypothetical protein